MNEAIQKERESWVLKLRSVRVREEESAEAELFHGDEPVLGPITIPLRLFGIEPGGESRGYQRFEFAVDQGNDRWRNVLERFRVDLSAALRGDGPLWIEFVTPRGDLPLVPWERVLALEDGVSVLRWPYHVNAPFTRRGRHSRTEAPLEIVVCTSSPHAKAAIGTRAILGNAIESIAGLNLPSRFHVFAEIESYEELSSRFAQLVESGRMVIYPPESAAEYGEAERTRRITSSLSDVESPWLLWIRDQLVAPRVDLVLFLCHGYLSAHQGSLALAESPLVNNDDRWARFVGSAELGNFLNQVGAWSAGFLSPGGNFSEAALWALADEMAEVRSGPVWVADAGMYESDCRLKELFLFLYGRDCENLPASPHLTLYCHPDLLISPDKPLPTGEFSNALESLTLEVNLESAAPQELILEAPFSDDPKDRKSAASQRWISASQRILEQKAADIVDLESLRSSGSAKRGLESLDGAIKGKTRALSFVRNLLRESIEKGEGSGFGGFR